MSRGTTSTRTRTFAVAKRRIEVITRHCEARDLWRVLGRGRGFRPRSGSTATIPFCGRKQLLKHDPVKSLCHDFAQMGFCLHLFECRNRSRDQFVLQYNSVLPVVSLAQMFNVKTKISLLTIYSCSQNITTFDKICNDIAARTFGKAVSPRFTLKTFVRWPLPMRQENILVTLQRASRHQMQRYQSFFTH